jgi:hypothetical protein
MLNKMQDWRGIRQKAGEIDMLKKKVKISLLQAMEAHRVARG